MIDAQRLAETLTGTIGLYQGFKTGSDVVADIHAEPSLYLSDATPMLRPELLSSMGSYLSLADYPTYDSNKAYKKHDVVKVGSDLFEAVVKGTGNDTANPLKWQITTPLSAWFGRLERGAIVNLGMELASNPPVKNVLDKQAIFATEGNIQGVLSKSGRFLGCRINMRKKDTALQLARIGLQLTGAVTNFPVYLYHSSSIEPVKVFYLTGNNPNRTIWLNANYYIFQQVGGYYTVGYYESDLPIDVRVIGSQRGFDVAGCTSCGGGVDYSLAQQRSTVADFQGIFVDGPGLTTGVQDWPTETDVKLQNWGFNFVIDARCDVTDLLLENSTMLSNMLLYMVACQVLEELRTTTRANADAALLKSTANVILYGQANSKTDYGLVGKRDSMLSKLKTVMLNLSPNCMQTTPQGGVLGVEWGSLFD